MASRSLPIEAQAAITYLRKSNQRPGQILFDTLRGDTGDTLHAKCGNFTVFVVAETDKGEVFAGCQYLSRYSQGYLADNNAWFMYCRQNVVFRPAAHTQWAPQHDVFVDRCFAPTWGGGYCLFLGNIERNFEDAYANPDPSYVCIEGPAITEKSEFKVTRLFISSVTSTVHTIAVARLQMMEWWNYDEAEQLQHMFDKTMDSDVSPSTFPLDSKNVESFDVKLRGSVSCTAVEVVSAATLSFFDPARLRTDEWKRCLQDARVGRLSLSLETLPPVDKIINIFECNIFPHLHCIEMWCTSKADVEVVAGLLAKCPPILKFVRLTRTSSLDDSQIDPLVNLHTDHHVTLCFDSNMNVSPTTITKMVRSNLSVEFLYNQALPLMMSPPSTYPFEMRRASLQCDVGSSQVGFATFSPAETQLLCVACDAEKAKQYSVTTKKLLGSIISCQDNDVAATGPLIFTSSNAVLSELTVALFVGFLEHVVTPAAHEEALRQEALFCIRLPEEVLWQRITVDAGSGAERTPAEILKLVSQLLSIASFLEVPALKRLLRSLLVRAIYNDQPVGVRTFFCGPAL